MSKLPIEIENIDLKVESKQLQLQFKTYDSSNNKPPLKIVIDNQKTFICKNEYSENAYIYNITDSYNPTLSEEMFEYDSNITIDLPEIATVFIPNIEDNLYFIYIYSTGDTADEPYLEAVIPVYDEQTVYSKTFDVIKKDFSGCNTFCKESVGSVNAIIALKGLEYALIAGDYRKAVTFWDIITRTPSTITSNCNCS